MVQNIQRYISQLGMMIIAVGLSSYNLAVFHLVNHAFYKGLLFLGAGAVIHAVADNQDFRKYGGLIAFLPLTYSVMLIASLSLVAFPYMTGFYSKDFILESAYGQFHYSSVAVYFIATIGAMFTTLYSVKVLYLTFLTNANGPLVNYKKAHEGDMFMSLPLIILAIFSIFFGYITKDIFIGMASGFFSDNSLFIHPLHEIMLETEFAVPTLFKLLPLYFTITLSAACLVLSEFLPRSLVYFKFTRLGYNIFSFFNQRFLIELFYNKYITRLSFKLGGQTTKVLDKGSIEQLGPWGLEKGLLKLSKSISSLDTGVITSYALYILIGLILYILIPSISFKDISILLLIIFALSTMTIDTFTNTYSIPKRKHFVSDPVQSRLIIISSSKRSIDWLLILFISGYALALCTFFILAYFSFDFSGFYNLLSLQYLVFSLELDTHIIFNGDENMFDLVLFSSNGSSDLANTGAESPQSVTQALSETDLPLSDLARESLSPRSPSSTHSPTQATGSVTNALSQTDLPYSGLYTPLQSVVQSPAEGAGWGWYGATKDVSDEQVIEEITDILKNSEKLLPEVGEPMLAHDTSYWEKARSWFDPSDAMDDWEDGSFRPEYKEFDKSEYHNIGLDFKYDNTDADDYMKKRQEVINFLSTVREMYRDAIDASEYSSRVQTPEGESAPFDVREPAPHNTDKMDFDMYLAARYAKRYEYEFFAARHYYQVYFLNKLPYNR